jgi:hypothetical protein
MPLWPSALAFVILGGLSLWMWKLGSHVDQLSVIPDAISNGIDRAKFFSRSHDAVIRVYDYAGNVIETHEHKGDFREP